MCWVIALSGLPFVDSELFETPIVHPGVVVLITTVMIDITVSYGDVSCPFW